MIHSLPRSRALRPAAVVIAAALLAASACQRTTPDAPTLPAPKTNPEASGPPFFEEITAGSGIDFTYRNGEESGHYAILESLGGGLALIDFDNDGKLDVLLVGGGHYEGPEKKDIKGYPCKLLRNKGNCKFEDVSDRLVLDGPWFYSHGAAVTDFDRDGWPDVLITGWGRMALLHNEPADPKDPSKGRKLVDVTAKVSLPTGLWTTSAAWGDLDGDGYPDLYVCQYVDWNFEKNHPLNCMYDGKTRDVCPPKQFTGLPHKLFLNKAGRSFADVSKEAGVRMPREAKDYDLLSALPKDAIETLKKNDNETDTKGDTRQVTRYGKGLGVLMVDVNGDGKPDIYVANDTVDNFLYMNRTKAASKLLFEEKGMETGTARDDGGQPQGSMGVAAGDPEGSGRPWIWVTNYEGELHALYKNDCVDGGEFFTFATKTARLAVTGQDTVGWGTGFLDLDHHGWEDLFYATGHAIRHPTNTTRAQRPGLFRNTGKARFSDVRARGGAYFQKPHLSRGVVLGDLDNDGKIDLIISHINEPVAVLKNIADTSANHWLGLALEGKDKADVVGARVVLQCAGRTQTRFATGGGSYCSSGDRRHVFGLGPAKGDDLKLTVAWPSGKEQAYAIPLVDQYYLLTEGVADAKPMK